MRWLGENWLWLLAVGGMVWMHLGMHRGHGGGHGGHEHRPKPGDESRDHNGPSAAGNVDSAEGGGHRHRGC